MGSRARYEHPGYTPVGGGKQYGERELMKEKTM